MFGSLDCCHTVWKNCPKVWKGSFKGKEKKATIVMEALSDYNLWFWHIANGNAGTKNDKTILNVSSLMESFLDGSFSTRKKDSGAVPFTIEREEFSELFCLVDGIYPPFSRFVKGIKEPTTDAESKYTSWQEGARKDIERAFGVLQGAFKFTGTPIQLHNPKQISARLATCIMLHNMKVSDRVNNGDVSARYKTNRRFCEREEIEVMMGEDEVDDRNTIQQVGNHMLGTDRWENLSSEVEHARLYRALMKKFG